MFPMYPSTIEPNISSNCELDVSVLFDLLVSRLESFVRVVIVKFANPLNSEILIVVANKIISVDFQFKYRGIAQLASAHAWGV
jgi:hypothetical protein